MEIPPAARQAAERNKANWIPARPRAQHKVAEMVLPEARQDAIQ